MIFTKTIFNGASDIDVVVDEQYLIEGYVYVNTDPINNPTLKLLVWKPTNIGVAGLDTYTFFKPGTTPYDTWVRLTSTFTATATGSIKIGLYQEYTNEGNNTTGNVDSLTIKGPLDVLTEKKTILYDTDCLYKNYHVRFLDSLGGYSYWTFRTYRDTGINIGQSRQIKRNIFSDFSTTFKNAQAQNDYTSVESRDTLTLRAENLTEQQAVDLFELVRSVRAYDFNDPENPKVLLIDKNSVNITQGEKLYNLTFNATSTFDNYRQRQ